MAMKTCPGVAAQQQRYRSLTLSNGGLIPFERLRRTGPPRVLLWRAALRSRAVDA